MTAEAPKLKMPHLSSDKQLTFIKLAVLSMAAILSFATRLFSVLRFESVIHEFDPYFNYRTTRYLTEEGFYNFHNWFDDRAWYPLGRIIGGTIYPGLMVTSATLYNIMQFLNITIDIRNVCVFLAPFFSSLTTIVTYLLTKELKDEGAGLVAAAMIAIVPGYISRSVAGSYDNEGIAIFCMLLTYYFWIKAVNTGTILWATLTALAYFYMVSSWGGYVFLINLIPLHVLALMCLGRFSARVYVAYSTLYTVGTILSMQISFVGFQPVQSSEHMLALGTFGLCQLYAFAQYLRSKLSPANFELLFKALVTALLATLGTGVVVLTVTGKISPWTGRFYSLLDPSYAKNHIPIIASVSEHQPTSWSSFYFDLQVLVFLFPAGLYFCFSKLTDANIFIILYGVLSIYFAGVMVRLMLVLAPVMCIVSGVAASSLLSLHVKDIEPKVEKHEIKKKKHENNLVFRSEVGAVFVCVLSFLLITYVFHCTWVTSEAYSSPSIVLSARAHDGARIIFDDFREAYTWLKMNTPESIDNGTLRRYSLARRELALLGVTSEAYSSPSIVLSARAHDGARIIFDDFREAYTWLKMNTPESIDNGTLRWYSLARRELALLGVTSEAYSSPSIVLSARAHDGARIIFDDFREAYTWLKMNTPESIDNVTLRWYSLARRELALLGVTSEAYSSPSIVLSARAHDGARIIFDDFREAYTWLKMNTPEAYSSPSIVLSARAHDGARIIFDDFREAYTWLKMNTPEDSKVMSWWDYGYQITAMANRTVIVDNNTWNNTHISRVGQAMASGEQKAYEIMTQLDVDYVLVIFGGLVGYSSDDINKFLWMVRIGGSTEHGAHIKEADYYTPGGEFRVDADGSHTLLNCLMYKMSYYKFGLVYTEGGRPPGFDRVRGSEIGNKDFNLDVLEEAYTTEHWLVRIYKVKPQPNRGV
ncbi:unnamed protein product [Plutella xylostella]|uniref:Dolichyl-diphosphooligosaccharide--protein glycosyltransferase subunit STT3A n=1 Tax=Plutella xylostella TaxID=51655 RepID=A0A8S4E6Y3_PLUXY|nr:unnamed protein product [Plutella xylostella]